MTTVKNGTQAFLKSTHKMAVKAQKEGANITKAEVTKALGQLTADGKVSKADVSAAKSLLESAPLTAGAKDALKNFVHEGPRTTNGKNSPLNIRLRGGGESTVRTRGGGESNGHVSRGGGESGNAVIRDRLNTIFRGGGESGGGGGWSRGGGE